MPGPPEEVVAALVRGIGAYLKATPAQELPPRFRPIRGFTPKGLGPQRGLILSALEDPGVRGRIGDWLKDGKHPLSKKDADLLRTAAGAEGDWRASFEAPVEEAEPRAGVSPARVEALEKAAQRERDKARRAREDSRRVRQESDAAVKAASARTDELEARVKDLQRSAREAGEDAVVARSAQAKVEEQARRRARTWQRDLQRQEEKASAIRQEVRDLRRELRAVRAEADKLKRPSRAVPTPPEVTRPARPRARKRLPFTKGLLADDPQMLARWLEVPDVHLLVDGYNVTKAESGFGELELAGQRRRLVDETNKLARRKKIETTIVFDGSEVPAGVARLPRGPVKVRYSAPDEIADDHLVALLESWPPYPVIVVTNDRELQGRAEDLGATIATSGQLLALLR